MPCLGLKLIVNQVSGHSLSGDNKRMLYCRSRPQAGATQVDVTIDAPPSALDWCLRGTSDVHEFQPPIRPRPRHANLWSALPWVEDGLVAPRPNAKVLHCLCTHARRTTHRRSESPLRNFMSIKNYCCRTTVLLLKLYPGYYIFKALCRARRRIS